MNVLLIHPYIISDTPIFHLNEPIGLICLASYLEDKFKDSVNVSILDLYLLGYDAISKYGEYYYIGISDKEKIIKMVKDKKPNIIGITNQFTTFSRASFELANLIKSNFPDALLVIGGAHATIDAENILKMHCNADIVVRGEGEITFYELIERVKNKASYHDLLGIAFREDENVVTNPARPLIPDINLLPIPDRKFIKQDIYSKINKKQYYLSFGKKVASIITSRGCPFNCVFCSTKVVWQRKYRPRKAELVIKEMEYLIKDFNIDEFIINDDQFFGNKKRTHEILDMIITRNLKVHLNIASGSSGWLLDKTLLIKLKKAGFYRLTFPIESGSETTLNYIRKPINLEKIKNMIKIANYLGFWTYGNFIIGFPYERREDIEKTIQFANRSQLDYLTFFIAKPYAGSEMYQHFLNEGLIKRNRIFNPTSMAVADNDTVYMRKDELNQIIRKAQKKYSLYILSNYFNPIFFITYFIQKIGSKDGLFYFLKYIKNVFITQFILPIIKNKLKIGISENR